MRSPLLDFVDLLVSPLAVSNENLISNFEPGNRLSEPRRLVLILGGRTDALIVNPNHGAGAELPSVAVLWGEELVLDENTNSCFRCRETAFRYKAISANVFLYRWLAHGWERSLSTETSATVVSRRRNQVRWDQLRAADSIISY